MYQIAGQGLTVVQAWMSNRARIPVLQRARVCSGLHGRVFAAGAPVATNANRHPCVPNLDLERVLVMTCAAEAIMHPRVLAQSTPATARKMSKPAEAYRGSISRVLLAERTGLPRETVRRTQHPGRRGRSECERTSSLKTQKRPAPEGARRWPPGHCVNAYVSW